MVHSVHTRQVIRLPPTKPAPFPWHEWVGCVRPRRFSYDSPERDHARRGRPRVFNGAGWGRLGGVFDRGDSVTESYGARSLSAHHWSGRAGSPCAGQSARKSSSLRRQSCSRAHGRCARAGHARALTNIETL